MTASTPVTMPAGDEPLLFGSLDTESKVPNLMDEFCKDMMRLFTQPILSDLTLIIGAKNYSIRFKVHKSILAARCQYFFGLFHSAMKESKMDELYFPQHNPSDWKVLLDYIYSAKINIDNENAFGVLKLSDEYGIVRVKERCIEYVKGLVTDENVLDVFEESRYHNFVELHSFCKGYIEENARRVFFCESFLKLAKEGLKELLMSDKIQLSELEIFVAVINWGKYHVQTNITGNKGDTASTNKNVLAKKPSKSSSKRNMAPNQIVTYQLVSAESDVASFCSSLVTPISTANISTLSSVDDTDQDSLKRISLSESTSLSPSLKSTTRKRGSSFTESNGHSPAIETRNNEEDEDNQLSFSEASHRNDEDEDEEEKDEDEKEDQLADEDENESNHFTHPRTPTFSCINSSNEFITSYHRSFGLPVLTSESNSTVDPSAPSLLNSPSLSSAMPSSFVNEQDAQRFRERLATLFDYVTDKAFVRKLAQYLNDILPLVRFGILNPNEVYDYVEPSLVVSNDLLLEAYRSHALSDRSEVQDSSRLKVREGSLFYISGVLENVPIKLLRGWTCIYHKPYADKTSEQVFRTAITQGTATRILVAARHKNSNTLALAAMGRINVVLKETSDLSPCNLENGVYWYHWKNHSFGFSDTRNINLGTADLLDGKFKLSWHLTGRGGYRVGDIKNLNESKEWEKLLFTS